MLIWFDARGTAQSFAGDLPRIADRATADIWLKQFADANGLKGPMQGSGERTFDRYVACYNARGGSLALAARQDAAKSAPYLYVDQNDQERATRYGGQKYDAKNIKRASTDFLTRKKAAYSGGERPAS